MDRSWLTVLVLTLAASFAVAEIREKLDSDRKDVLISLLKKYIGEEDNVQEPGKINLENEIDEAAEDKLIENEISRSRLRQAVDPCGASQPLILSTASGTILSPGYASGKYPGKDKCSWKIVAPAGKVVKLTFNSIEIEQSNECAFDRVQVWDVRGGKAFKIGHYCGKTNPAELLRSTGQTMYVYFLSDDADSNGRFSVSWTFVTPPAPLSSSLCGNPRIKPDTTSKIVNGDQARPHSWPWQISLRLMIGTKQYHICGGTIISKNVVLCAAHCLFDESHTLVETNQFLVVAGDHDQKTSSDGATQNIAIKQIIYHDKYNPASASSAYDIAVFLLSTDIRFSDNVAPACLPTENVTMDSLCYATGWGDTKETADQTILNQVRLPIVSQTQCRQNNYYGAQITNSMLCAGYAEGGKDACQGDSGGPFVCFNQFTNLWYIHGVTSWGAGCAEARKPGVYTRTTSYLDWIKAKSGVTP